jgi:hypothetical protein
MGKAGRGLPEGFDLDIDTGSPAILGDFLDEVASAHVPTPAPEIPEPRIIRPSAERQTKSIPAGISVAPMTTATDQVENPKVVPLQRGGYAKPPRFELSLNHETKRMVHELLNYLQAMGPQPAAGASEMFRGIISVLHRAKDVLDLSSLPRRGQWGSPTAKAFPIALGQAFAKAIAEQYLAEMSNSGLDSQATAKVLK